jgi:hypothetical protein
LLGPSIGTIQCTILQSQPAIVISKDKLYFQKRRSNVLKPTIKNLSRKMSAD